MCKPISFKIQYIFEILANYPSKVRNRFKDLDLIDRVPDVFQYQIANFNSAKPST